MSNSRSDRTARPSAPRRDVTTGRPTAIASITLLRTPPPERSGAAITTCRSIRAFRSGTNPAISTDGSDCMAARTRGATRASSSRVPCPATVKRASGNPRPDAGPDFQIEMKQPFEIGIVLHVSYIEYPSRLRATRASREGLGVYARRDGRHFRAGRERVDDLRVALGHRDYVRGAPKDASFIAQHAHPFRPCAPPRQAGGRADAVGMRDTADFERGHHRRRPHDRAGVLGHIRAEELDDVRPEAGVHLAQVVGEFALIELTDPRRSLGEGAVGVRRGLAEAGADLDTLGGDGGDVVGLGLALVEADEGEFVARGESASSSSRFARDRPRPADRGGRG